MIRDQGPEQLRAHIRQALLDSDSLWTGGYGLERVDVVDDLADDITAALSEPAEE